MAPELKRMVRQRLAEKSRGDESWWDNVWTPETQADIELRQLEQSYQYVEQSREEKGLNYVGD